MLDQILPTTWDPKHAGDRVLAGLVNVCSPQVKGAHDIDWGPKRCQVPDTFSVPQPGDNGARGDLAAAHHRLSVASVGQVGTLGQVLPDLGLDGLRDQLSGPLPQQFREPVGRPGWKRQGFEGKVCHGGVR
jgi:hypothetical protein